MTITSPLVSVCVANFNGVGVIERCIESVLDQECEAAIEILVHDDASNDQSVFLLESSYPQITLLKSTENVGFCRANNRMVDKAKGDYILLLNNDAWLTKGAIATLLRGASRYPNAVLTLPQFQAESGELVDCGMFQDIFANPVMQKSVKEGPVAMAMGSCLWISRDLWSRFGGLPEWFGSMAEDMYLCSYARLIGCKVIALGESGYFHHVGHSFGGGKVLDGGVLHTTVKRRRLSERNKTWIIALFYPFPIVYLFLPLHLVFLLIEGLLLSLLKRDASFFFDIYWYAIVSCFNRNKLLRIERKKIQLQRRIGVFEFLKVYKFIPYKLQMLIAHGLPRLS